MKSVKLSMLMLLRTVFLTNCSNESEYSHDVVPEASVKYESKFRLGESTDIVLSKLFSGEDVTFNELLNFSLEKNSDNQHG